ncbi:hypothetical protein J4221_03485 [Candidatus Pacearchaeota archaeon]|nr:hypothetical protein [Candidatus Pacearchaeota archaeon]
MQLELFFDHIGFLIWIFLIWIAIADLQNKRLNKFTRYIVLAIGIAGILLDGILLIGLYFNMNFIQYAWLFDHLGIPVFLFLGYMAYSDLNNKHVRKKWPKWILFLLSIGGLLADGFILMRFYLGA